MYYNELDDDCMESFGDFIQNSQNIEYISIGFNKLTDKGIEILLPYLFQFITTIFLNQFTYFNNIFISYFSIYIIYFHIIYIFTTYFPIISILSSPFFILFPINVTTRKF